MDGVDIVHEDPARDKKQGQGSDEFQPTDHTWQGGDKEATRMVGEAVLFPVEVDEAVTEVVQEQKPNRSSPA